MPRERRRKSGPRDRPDITPLIYGDPDANLAIERVTSPEGIDAFVKYLRTVFFRKWIGYEPILVVSRPHISDTMKEAQERRLLTPDNYASGLWNQTFRNYPGTVDNLQASFVPFDSELTAVQTPYVHRLSAVTFRVEGVMHSEVGVTEGEVRRKYSLVLNHLGKPNILPQRLLDQALIFYSREETRERRAVQLSTAIENTDEVRRIISEAHDRVYRSRLAAEAAERKGGFTRPAQAGLPGLGKRS